MDTTTAYVPPPPLSAVEVGVVARRRNGVRAVGRDDHPLEHVIRAETVQRQQHRVAAAERVVGRQADSGEGAAYDAVAETEGGG
jgi:hypothetical protein